MNKRGSTILMVTMLMAAFSASTYVMLSSASRSNQFQQQRLALQQADAVSESMSILLSDPQVCLDGFDGPGGDPGLTFIAAGGGAGNFSASLTNSSSGQDIQLPSPYPGNSGRKKYANGLVIPNSSLALNRLYLSSATVDPTDPNTYTVKIKGDIQSTSSRAQVFRPHDVADLKITVDGTGAMTVCKFQAGAGMNQTICQSMGCTYTVAAVGASSCNCPLEPMTCPTGSYINAFSGSSPVCSPTPLVKTCAATAGSFIAGFDSASDPICAIVTSCPGGTSTTGAGAVANPTVCKCINVGENWNGTSCGFAYAGICGTANGATLASAPSTIAEKCSVGSSSAISGTGPWNWTCYGDYGGSNTACATVSAPSINGVCGPSNGASMASAPSSGLCSTGTATAVSGSGPWNWSCNGAGGGLNAACTANFAPGPVNGLCGPADGTTVPTAPSSNLCSAGSATAVGGTGPWAWSCNGTGGGSNIACSANLASGPVNGLCGTADSTTVGVAPSTGPELCSTGTSTAVTGTGPWNWSCNGSGGGANTACSANLSASPINGVCGTSNGGTYGSAPSSGLCSTGSQSAVAGSGPWTWSCSGSGGGSNDSCSASLAASPVNGVCGSSDGSTVASAPSSNLCSAGGPTSVSGAGPWSWSCIGTGGGSNAACSANLSVPAVNGACGTANGTTVVSAPSSNLCSAGNATSVAGTGPWSWSCNGTGGGSNANCSASAPADPCSVVGACQKWDPVYVDAGMSNPRTCASINGVYGCSVNGATYFQACNLARYEFTCRPGTPPATGIFKLASAGFCNDFNAYYTKNSNSPVVSSGGNFVTPGAGSTCTPGTFYIRDLVVSDPGCAGLDSIGWEQCDPANGSGPMTGTTWAPYNYCSFIWGGASAVPSCGSVTTPCRIGDICNVSNAGDSTCDGNVRMTAKICQ